jgi:hypothetical protein
MAPYPLYVALHHVQPTPNLMLTVLNILSYSGQPAAACQLISYCSFALSLLLLLLSYAISLLFARFYSFICSGS